MVPSNGIFQGLLQGSLFCSVKVHNIAASGNEYAMNSTMHCPTKFEIFSE